MFADLGLLVSQPEQVGLDCVRRVWGKTSAEARGGFQLDESADYAVIKSWAHSFQVMRISLQP